MNNLFNPRSFSIIVILSFTILNNLFSQDTLINLQYDLDSNLYKQREITNSSKTDFYYDIRGNRIDSIYTLSKSEESKSIEIIIGSWRIIDYEDSRTMSAEERRITEEIIEALKKQALLTYNADRTFSRTGYTPDVQRGYWEYDSKKRKIYLIAENVNQKEEINIFNLSETEMTIVVTELFQDLQGNQETVTAKITFKKQ